MPDHRKHRGSHPEDDELFSAEHWPALRAASADVNWLLDRDYALPSTLALVGNRYGLTQRQRLAIGRCACTSAHKECRLHHRTTPEALSGESVWIDGYNVLITVEAALSGGVILRGRDGWLRDMASLHGTYRPVAETRQALYLIADTIAGAAVKECQWLLDRPVSNSGALRELILATAHERRQVCVVDLEFDPDTLLSQTGSVVATSDSVILDRCARSWDLAAEVISRNLPEVSILDLGNAESPAHS